MQPLTKVMQGATCTVKWALGLPETVEKLHELKNREVNCKLFVKAAII